MKVKNPLKRNATREKLHSSSFVLDAELPWKSEEAAITISKVTSNVKEEYIQIHIISRKEKAHFIAEITPKDFALAITGLSYRPCDFRIE